MSRSRTRRAHEAPAPGDSFDLVRLGASLKHARERLGIPLRVVAQLAGYSVTHVSQVERGRTCPTIGALVRIAAALGRDPAYFLEGETRPEVSAPGTGERRRFRARSKTTSLHVAWLSSGIAGGKLVAGRVTVGPHARAGEAAVLRVPAVQMCHVLHGRLQMQTESGSFQLGPGDSAMIHADVEVCLHNPGPEDAELVCLLVNDRPGGTPASGFVLGDAPRTDSPGTRVTGEA